MALRFDACSLVIALGIVSTALQLRRQCKRAHDRRYLRL
jgi:hypothetical protein